MVLTDLGQKLKKHFAGQYRAIEFVKLKSIAKDLLYSGLFYKRVACYPTNYRSDDKILYCMLCSRVQIILHYLRQI